MALRAGARYLAPTIACVAVLVFAVAGCERGGPPAAEDFKPPETSAPETAQAPVAEQTDSGGPVVVEPTDTPEPEPAAPAKVEQPPEEAPAAPAAAATEKEPEIYGQWRVVGGSRNGEDMPMPDGMQLTYTFQRDGTFVMAATGAPEGAPAPEPGSFTLDGDQITIDVMGDSASGELVNLTISSVELHISAPDGSTVVQRLER